MPSLLPGWFHSEYSSDADACPGLSSLKLEDPTKINPILKREKGDGEERDIKGDTFNFPIYELSFLPLQLF